MNSDRRSPSVPLPLRSPASDRRLRAGTGAAGDTVIVVEKPTYATIALETTVNKPVAEVWRRVGQYCAIGEWLQIPAGCKMLSGKEGEIGSVRSVATEVLVAKTEVLVHLHAAGARRPPYNLYHGTVEARAASPTTTRAALHARLRQLDAAGRCGAREGSSVAHGDVHARAAEHEDAGRGWHAAAAATAGDPAARRRAERALRVTEALTSEVRAACRGSR